jgi:hypothetical protein
MVNVVVFKGDKSDEVKTRIDPVVEEDFPPPHEVETMESQ